jgi:apolipoprotein N-acyltransferase
VIRALLSAAVSAVLLGIAARLHAPSNLVILVALLPWMSVTARSPPRAALVSAAALACAMIPACFPFLPPAIAGYTGWPLPLAWLVTLALAPVLIEPQLLAATWARIMAPRFKAGVFVAAYLAAEWALPRLLPDTLGIALQPTASLRQLAELGGVSLLTALCLVVSSMRRLRQGLIAALLLGTLAALGTLRFRAVEEDTAAAPTFAAGVVQAAIGNYDKLAAERGTYEAVRQILDAHFALSERLAGRIDLLVWPETVYPTTFGQPKSDAARDLDAEIAARTSATPFVFGAFEDSDAGEHNAAFVLEHGGYETYRKSALFPLTEHVPAWLEPMRQPWMGHWQPGSGPKLITATVRGASLRIAPLICYETMREGIVHEGADLIVTLSNDGWFADGLAPRLHLAAAALRSVEARVPQVRATNSGISALILPSGEIVGPTRFGERAATRYDVPRVAPAGSPLRARWVGPGAFALACALLGWGRIDTARIRRRNKLRIPPSGD